VKGLSRRRFIKLCSATAAGLGLARIPVPSVAEAFTAASKGKPVVLWLQGASCSGCTSSLLNSTYPELRQLLQDIIQMKFHPGLTVNPNPLPAEELLKIAQEYAERFILLVEGAVPTAGNGAFCLAGKIGGRGLTFMELVKNLGQRAKMVVALGTCASYGGVAAAKPNPAGCVGVNTVIASDKVLNIPGCPPHPDWIIGSLAYSLMYGKMPPRDDFGRVLMFYGGVIHDNCPRRQYFDNSKFALKFGEMGCLLELGCRGPMAFADCSNRQWNTGKNWCIRSGGPCLSCTHPNFPDGTSPVYERMPNVSVMGITTTADTIGKIAGTVTALGVGAHFAGNILAGRNGSKKQPPVNGGGQ